MIVLLDTSFLLALVFPRDTNHHKARQAAGDLKGTRVIPMPMLTEFFYMAMTRMSYEGAVRAFRVVRTGAFQIEPLTPEDMARMDEIMSQYHDNRFDFVDAAIMALSERLKITAVYTFDRRDFPVFKPSHTDYLELLP
jgi:hypothetical protein